MPRSFDLKELDLPADSEIHELVQRCTDIKPLVYDADEYLIREKEASLETFIVLRGAFVVEQTEVEGRPPATLAILTTDLDEPSFIGEMAYLGEGHRTASVRISFPTYVLQLKPKTLDLVIADFPFFTKILCKQLTSRLTEANRLLKENNEKFAMEARQIVKRAQEVVLQEGALAEVLYQLLVGTLVREDTGESFGREHTYEGFFGAAPFFCDLPHPHTVRAKTDTMLVAISSRSKLALVRNYPELLINLYKKRGDSPL